MRTLNNVLPQPGQPEGWNVRHRAELKDIILPEGAVYYSTPGHGYLRVDFNILPASVSVYDYLDEPHHALLEEDCSMTMWLAEMKLIPMKDYILTMIKETPRTSAYGLLHPGQVVVEAGIVAGIGGNYYRNEQRIIAGTPHREPMPAQLVHAIAKGTSVQTGLPGIGPDSAQVKMFEECNTAVGQGGSNPGLFDVEKIRRTVT